MEDLTSLEVVRLDEGELPKDVVIDLDDGYVDKGGKVYDTMLAAPA